MNFTFVCFLLFSQIPHAQDRMPGPPLSPEEALKAFKTRPGFQVKLFASEPDVVNPTAMTFDERGRVWVCESLEYPRRQPGPGKDRIRILEDTDGDGKADKVSTFAEGLNIPSGILHGYGGVFVANAPDILFLKDTDGDGKADHKEVLLTGFGRDDTHELPNSFIWGPDGWLYGLNGVFNPAVVTHQGKTHRFTCALWRYHPRTRKFELFCEGTSNPWGLDYNENGDFFVSACVIDHLWHLTETGYYHRQGGPYPPFTWKIGSIVDYKHQKAAYCGLCFYDADAYPEEYRRTMFMGNIHGNCINNDAVKKFGASYKGSPRPDFLSTDDAWFMPVVQKVGPDGCLWIVDWYDRYHCYQDANRDPAGIDRLKGRIYRVTYNDTPMAKGLDLGRLQADDLYDMAAAERNIWKRREARRLYVERNQVASIKPPQEVRSRAMGFDHAWMVLHSECTENDLCRRLLASEDERHRVCGVRGAIVNGWLLKQFVSQLKKMIGSEQSPEVLVQLAIAAPKLGGDPVPMLLQILVKSDTDPSGLLPRICWRNLEPHLDGKVGALVQQLQQTKIPQGVLKELLPRVLDRCLATQKEQPNDLLALLGFLFESKDKDLAATALSAVARAELDGELTPAFRNEYLEKFHHRVAVLARPGGVEDSMTLPSLALVELYKPQTIRWTAVARHQAHPERILLVRALAKGSPDRAAGRLGMLLSDPKIDVGFARELLSVMATLNRPEAADWLLSVWKTLPAEAAPQVLDALTSRPAWAAKLMDAVEKKKIPTAAINVNQIRRMAEFGDQQLAKRVAAVWGQVRNSRNPNREKIVAEYMKFFNRGSTGNPTNGAKVYEKVCAQCHQFRGKGVEVGPKLDDNGRTGLPLLVSNMLDPSLVIGTGYQARLVVMEDGRSLTGLVVEDSPTRLVLKVAGDKREVLPKDKIERQKVSDVSMMPEDLEKQITPKEFRDLVAYLMAPE